MTAIYVIDLNVTSQGFYITYRLTTTSPFNSFHSVSVSIHNLTVNIMHLIFIVYCASTTYSSWGRGVVLVDNILTTILEKHNLL